MPVQGEVLYGYGWLPQGRKVHEGLDLSASIGDKVVAISDGTVVRVGSDRALGAFVEIDHGFVVALYGQISGATVKASDTVKQGQKLAAVAKPTGQEGDDAPHLHLEVRVKRGGNPVDPSPYLPGGETLGGN
jgi:murein DD-endopeptidase MepM/ murein hydrolase activator NlpD